MRITVAGRGAAAVIDVIAINRRPTGVTANGRLFACAIALWKSREYPLLGDFGLQSLNGVAPLVASVLQTMCPP